MLLMRGATPWRSNWRANSLDKLLPVEHGFDPSGTWGMVDGSTIPCGIVWQESRWMSLMLVADTGSPPLSLVSIYSRHADDAKRRM